ncbi:MAG TPA: hypothetical protein VLD39_09005 [Gammaproteobacteria bacterium]|nr:hypothetical protein [Gammaproteobacteria bacterium]
MNILRAQTLGHSTATAAAVAALVFALAGPAQAMEEVTTRAAAAPTAALRADFEAQMASYARAVELELRDAVLQNLERSGAPVLRLARVSESHRG